MINRFFNHLGGVITLRIKGKNPEQLINLALSRGVYIWDVKWQGENLRMCIRNSALPAFQAIAAENGFALEIVSRRGWPFFKTKAQRRIGFFGGAALFVLILYGLSLFVWFVDVEGNQVVSTHQILQSAARHGLYQGSGKWQISCSEAEKAILRELPRLTYVQCEIQGARVHIRVVEKVWPDEEFLGPCHLVAKRDGVIEEVLLLQGQAIVKTGQIVGRGDILISGIVYPPEPEPTELLDNEPAKQPALVRARGIVKARTWYEGYGECPRSIEKRVLSGKTLREIKLITPWKEIRVKDAKISQNGLYQQEGKHFSVNTPPGLWGIYIKQYHEQYKNVKTYTEAQAIVVAREKGINHLRRKIQPGVEISDTRLEVLSSPGDAIVRIKVAIESIEDIGGVQPLE
ncbi:MAG TPA: sporulation protein YqfD [Syntrophomonas sp.]|nr:sporulation protein YqfD [Syntrophomonas sp.]